MVENSKDKIADSIAFSNDKDVKKSIFESIQDQRYSQRKWLFRLAFASAILGIALLVCLIILLFQQNLLESKLAHTVVIVVMSYSFGALHIMAKSLWNDKSYYQILKKDHEKNSRDKS